MRKMKTKLLKTKTTDIPRKKIPELKAKLGEHEQEFTKLCECGERFGVRQANRQRKAR